MNIRAVLIKIPFVFLILFNVFAAPDTLAGKKSATTEPTLPVEETLIHKFGRKFMTSLDGLQTVMLFYDNGREEKINLMFNEYLPLTEEPLVDPTGKVVKLKDAGVPKGISVTHRDIVFGDDSLAVIYSAYTISGSDGENDGGIFINGNQIAGPYDMNAVRLVKLSPDRKRFALVIEENKKWQVIIHNVSGSSEERITISNGIPFDKILELLFSYDGRKLAYTARQGKEWFVYIGESRIAGPFDEIRELLFSGESQKLAYTARQGKEWFVYIDKSRVAGPYPQIGAIALSTDGQSMAYAIKVKKNWQVMGDMIPPSAQGYDEIGAIDISSSCRHIAYSARKKDKWLAVVDNVELPPYFRIGAGPVQDPNDVNYLWNGDGGWGWGANPHFVNENEVEFIGWRLPKNSPALVYQVHVDIDSLVR